ncbi:hypothetical protein M3Y98_00143800 [Aphelenchoides besseyi]|nr:hypothetical protein M3Y98_00143800 [Aphelenchoides besseyi]KAI6199729.1 hypothetical protein M3Y96_00657700 [Aphelenchoides besseyi]
MADDEEELMTDADFEQALEMLCDDFADSDTKWAIAKIANEAAIISWEEAEQMLCNEDEPIKSSLPQQTRPTEPDNDTNIDDSIRRLQQNDPKLVKVNLNNMKRTPVPQIKRIIEAMRENEHIEMLSLANLGLYDGDVEPLIDILEINESLRVLNLETNYLSGEFFARLFQAALKNQTLEEIKAVNQGTSFSTVSEKQIIKAIFNNRGLLKVSVNFRLPEGRHKVEQATMRNQEIRRVLRRQAAEEARKAAEQQKPEELPVKKPTPVKPAAPIEPAKEKKPPVVIKTAPSPLKTAGADIPQKSQTEKEQPTKPVEVPKAFIEMDKPKTTPEVPKWRRPKPIEPPQEEKSMAMKPMILEQLPPSRTDQASTSKVEEKVSVTSPIAPKKKKLVRPVIDGQSNDVSGRTRLNPNDSGPTTPNLTATSLSESEASPSTKPKKIIKKKKKSSIVDLSSDATENASEVGKSDQIKPSEINGNLEHDEKPKRKKKPTIVVDEVTTNETKDKTKDYKPKNGVIEVPELTITDDAFDSTVPNSVEEKPVVPKKIVKKKKRVPTPDQKTIEDDETKPKIPPKVKPKPARRDDEPIGVFPRSRLNATNIKS